MSGALLAMPGEQLPSGEGATVCGAYVDETMVNHNKRYFPKLGDVVVGIVVHKTGDLYRLDIGSSYTALLSNIAFNAATKRHKPTLALGTAVLCFITLADPHLDIEVSCEDKSTLRDWSSGETLFGALTSSHPSLLVNVSVPFSSVLQSSTTSGTLAALGRHFKFEIAVGVNGRIWITAGSRREVLAISKILVQSPVLTNIQVEALTRAIQNPH